jgi:hypothetical protein
MVLTGSFVLSPVIGLFVTVPGAMRSIVTKFTSASRRQDHTTSPSATGAFVGAAIRVHRFPHSTFVTIAKRPSIRDGMIRFYCCVYHAVKSNFGKSEIRVTKVSCVLRSNAVAMRTQGCPWRRNTGCFLAKK